MSMIEINGLPIDCLVSFSQSVSIEHDYVVQTLDRKKHARWGSNRETLSLTIAPRTATDNDAVWLELTKPSDYVTLKYPDTSKSMKTKEFIVYSIQRPFVKKINGIYNYGKITAEYEER